MNIELTKNEIELLIDVLEEKLAAIPVVDASDRFDYGYLQSKLEFILKNEKSLS